MHTSDMHHGAKAKIFSYAKGLRRGQTPEEEKLWRSLRGRKLLGFKFRRQHPIQNYIADFYCNECKLIVELDGRFHLEKDQADYDAQRTKDLNDYGIRVIRFSNKDVRDNFSRVIDDIAKNLSCSPPSLEWRGPV